MQFDREQLAWAAGLFEGEGCLHFQNSPAIRSYGTYHTRGLVAIINIADEDVIKKFRDVVGLGKVFGPYKTKEAHHKPLFQWRVSSFENVQAVICLLWPWLGVRRKRKAKEILNNYHNAPSGRISNDLSRASD